MPTGANEKNRDKVAMVAFCRIAQRWRLSSVHRATLLGASEEQMLLWHDNPENASLSDDQLKRISYTLGIFRGLHIFYGGSSFADSWPTRVDAYFNEHTPLERMLSGTDGLLDVRRYVDWAAYGP